MNGEQYPSRGSRDHYRDERRERRRSRSPRGPRTRDGDDSYSSSRSYRERERDDRQSGRGRDRDWRDERRDHGHGRERERDHRRDDQRGGRGRDREHDRSGGGRAWDRDTGRGGHGGHGRDGRDGRDGREGRDGRDGRDRAARSNSPPQKKREPTPDLTGVVSVLSRKRRLTQWDIKPPGYENITAEQAKMSGMFPLPGAPRAQPMDPVKLQAFVNQPAIQATATALKPATSRQAKRLLVSNLPAHTTEEELINFFNLHLNNLNVVESQANPVLSATFAQDKDYALVEFKTAVDCTAALALDGAAISSAASNGNGVETGGISLRRPKDYISPTAEDSDYISGVEISPRVPDTASKLLITNIPIYLEDEQIQELLEAFGKLRAFVVARENGATESRGFAFCEYLDPANADVAIEGLKAVPLGDNILVVRRASEGGKQDRSLEGGVSSMSLIVGKEDTDFVIQESRVLQLLNMVTGDELLDDEDYEDILEDVKSECSKYGPVVEVKIPRPAAGGSRQVVGVGKVFVKFEDVRSAGKALRALAGRKFANRTVVTTYFTEESFDVGAW